MRERFLGIIGKQERMKGEGIKRVMAGLCQAHERAFRG